MKSGFLDKLIERLDKLDPESIQTQFLKLAQERGLLEMIFQSIQEGVIALDGRGRITYANRAAEHLMGFAFPSARGRPVSRFLRDIDWDRILRLDANEWSRLIGREIEITYPEHRFVNFYVVPMAAPGADTAAVVILRDVTRDRQNEATMLESLWWSCFLVEEAGAMHRAYEVDVVTQFPSSVYRYLSHNYSGLATAHMADTTFAEYGDDKRLDRQLMGRALLNDIGLTPRGAHGIIYHKEDAVRLLDALTEFGFFKDADIEKLPYWRNAPYVRIGSQPSTKSEVYVTVYRRPLPGAKGYQALFVVMNETFEPVELPLHLVDVERLLGGPNTLTATEVLEQTPVHESLKDWWRSASAGQATDPVLMDIESGDVVARQPGDTGSYGPIYIPYHDFRIFQARHVEDE